MNITKSLAILGIAGALAGCNLEVMTPKGGRVVSSQPAYDCAVSTNCNIEITGATFSESFTAIPEEGYVFSKWMGGDDFLCADSISTTCTVDNTPLAGDSRFDVFFASSLTLYIMPVFEQTGIVVDSDGDGLYDTEDPFPNDPYFIPLGSLVAVDANGMVWGPVLEEGEGWIRVPVKFEGEQDTYILRYMTSSNLLWGASYFGSTDCNPDTGEVYIQTDYLRLSEVIGPTFDGRYLVPNELAFAVYKPTVLSRLADGSCQSWDSTLPDWETPLRAIGPFDIALPLHKEYR